MKALLVFLTAMLLPILGQGKELRYKPLTTAVKPGDRLVISGFDGDITVSAAPKTVHHLSVRLVQENPSSAPAFAKNLFEEWSMGVRRQDQKILIEVQGPASKEDWKRLLREGGVPKMNLEISAPSLPLTINWRKGNVSVSNWDEKLFISQQSGHVTISKGKGDTTVSLNEGELTIQERSGQFSIQSYLAKVKLIDMQGSARLENFAGDSWLTDFKGQLSLVSYKGLSKVEKGSGRLDFKNGRAVMRIDHFDGEIAGKTDQGPITAVLSGKVDFRVHSNQGNVALKAADSGATVNAATQEGTLFVPSYLTLSRGANWKRRYGHLRGSQTGTVNVVTKTGDIRIYK